MTWSSTDLPATLTLNPATGELTGTTDVAGDYEFTVTVTDAFGTDSKLFHLSVAKGGAIVPPIDPPGPDPEPKPEPAPPVVPTLPETGGAQLGSRGDARRGTARGRCRGCHRGAAVGRTRRRAPPSSSITAAA